MWVLLCSLLVGGVTAALSVRTGYAYWSALAGLWGGGWLGVWLTQQLDPDPIVEVQTPERRRGQRLPRGVEITLADFEDRPVVCRGPAPAFTRPRRPRLRALEALQLQAGLALGVYLLLGRLPGLAQPLLPSVAAAAGLYLFWLVTRDPRLSLFLWAGISLLSAGLAWLHPGGAPLWCPPAALLAAGALGLAATRAKRALAGPWRTTRDGFQPAGTKL